MKKLIDKNNVKLIVHTLKLVGYKDAISRKIGQNDVIIGYTSLNKQFMCVHNVEDAQKAIKAIQKSYICEHKF
jgi:hypothetical protein